MDENDALDYIFKEARKHDKVPDPKLYEDIEVLTMALVELEDRRMGDWEDWRLWSD